MKAIQKIPLDQIDLTDETFSVNFMPELQNLRSSIEKIGLIQPVLLREKRDQYQIICGFRRISILKESAYGEVESRVFEEKEESELDFFFIFLHENLTSRGFNPIEKAIALDKLVHRFQVALPAVIQEYLPLFSLEPNEKILNTYLSLARMEEEVKAYVLKEEVSRSNIRILSVFAPDDRAALIPLLSSLKLSENRLRETLVFLEEITRRDRFKVNEILNRPEIETILCQKEMTPSQKTERIKKVLMDIRYPKMRRMEEGFEKMRKALHLPSGVSLHHSPHFEGKGLKVDFQFQTMEEYKAILSLLSQLVDKEEFKELTQSF